MTRGDVPEWAKKRACELANADISNPIPYRESHIGSYGHSAITALALYIAQHEEPPVDPLLAEARTICADVWESRGSKVAASQYRAGVFDAGSGPSMSIALAALRRGMELAKERQP